MIDEFGVPRAGSLDAIRLAARADGIVATADVGQKRLEPRTPISLTLFVQRRFYVSRRRRHLEDPARAAAGLPEGRSEHRKRDDAPTL